MDIIVPIVIAIIICIQFVFFIKNINRMNEFSNIFQCDTPWELERDFESDYVTGIKGKGNEVFESIKKSINKYLGTTGNTIVNKYETSTNLFQALEANIDIEYAIVPLEENLTSILTSNYYIDFHISDLNKYMILDTGKNNTFGSIMKKYYATWKKEELEKSE